MGLSVIQLPVGGFDANFSYIVHDQSRGHGAIVDPSGDANLILQTIADARITPVGILLTHTHHDHFDQLDVVLTQHEVPVYVHEYGSQYIRDICSMVQTVRDRETLVLGDGEVWVMYTPGHTDDSVCYIIDAQYAEDGVPKAITGDTLFVEGCGRTSRDGVQALYNSLIRLKALPDETEVYPGHDYGSKPHSTIGWEKEHNPYLQAQDFETFRRLRLG